MFCACESKHYSSERQNKLMQEVKIKLRANAVLRPDSPDLVSGIENKCAAFARPTVIDLSVFLLLLPFFFSSSFA